MRDLTIEKMRKAYWTKSLMAMESLFPRQRKVWVWGSGPHGWERIKRLWPEADGCTYKIGVVSPRYRHVQTRASL